MIISDKIHFKDTPQDLTLTANTPRMVFEKRPQKYLVTRLLS